MIIGVGFLICCLFCILLLPLTIYKSDHIIKKFNSRMNSCLTPHDLKQRTFQGLFYGVAVVSNLTCFKDSSFYERIQEFSRLVFPFVS